jgi:hypothetical protein
MTERATAHRQPWYEVPSRCHALALGAPPLMPDGAHGRRRSCAHVLMRACSAIAEGVCAVSAEDPVHKRPRDEAPNRCTHYRLAHRRSCRLCPWAPAPMCYAGSCSAIAEACAHECRGCGAPANVRRSAAHGTRACRHSCPTVGMGAGAHVSMRACAQRLQRACAHERRGSGAQAGMRRGAQSLPPITAWRAAAHARRCPLAPALMCSCAHVLMRACSAIAEGVCT